MARSQYSLPAEGKRDRSDPRGMAGYIRETAQKYGIDPDVALRVAKSEGLSNFQSTVVKKGVREPSWGSFQLYTGGGLGNEFQKATGLDPKDPANEKATIDYALKHAAKHGWGSWYGAKNTGIGEFEGIGGGKAAAADPAAGYGGIGSDAAASERAATAVKGTQTDTSAPEAPQTATAAPAGDFIDRLKNSQTGMQGLGEAISGLGQATASTGLGKGMYDTPPRAATVAAPGMMTPAMVPTVDPRQAEGQRQQLALAMQRLNSGKLY